MKYPNAEKTLETALQILKAAPEVVSKQSLINFALQLETAALTSEGTEIFTYNRFSEK